MVRINQNSRNNCMMLRNNNTANLQGNVGLIPGKSLRLSCCVVVLQSLSLFRNLSTCMGNSCSPGCRWWCL